MNLPFLSAFPEGLVKFFRGLGGAYRSLFAHEEVASLQEHVRREEEHAVWLVKALQTITQEIRIYSTTANSFVRGSILELLKECEAVLTEAESLERKFEVSTRITHDQASRQNEVDQVEHLTERLLATTEKALSQLRDAALVMKPMEAFRARRAITEGDCLVVLCRAQRPQRSKDGGSLKPTQLIRRLAVGSGPLPLVMAFDRHVHPKPAQPPAENVSAPPNPGAQESMAKPR